MSFRNTAVEYGTIAKSLHWTIAALFLISYCSVYYRRWFTVAEEDLSLWVGTPNYTALQLHLASGITIFAFVILRINMADYTITLLIYRRASAGNISRPVSFITHFIFL